MIEASGAWVATCSMSMFASKVPPVPVTPPPSTLTVESGLVSPKQLR